MLYYFGRFLFWLVFKFVFRLKVSGGDNIPSAGPALVCANHQSFIDPPVVGAAMRRPIHFMARHDLFTVPVLGWLIARTNAFPVKRTGAGDTAAFKNVFRLLEKGELLLLFPEGTRSRDGNLQKPSAGAGLIAYQARVPVIPCYVSGSRDILPRGSKFIKLHPLKVYFGPPVDLDACYGREKNKELYQEISARIMAGIAELKEKATHEN